MKKHVRIFLIPYASGSLMSEALTDCIEDAAVELGIARESLMAQFNIAAMSPHGAELTVAVEFFVDQAPAPKTYLQA